MTTQDYIGEELDLFAEAHHWKRYLFRQVQPFLGRRVLEVGAGIGGTTRALCKGRFVEWVCLEPDRKLAQRLRQRIDSGELPDVCRAVEGTLEDLPPGTFDTLLYIDVLEHIKNDRAELAQAARCLSPSGVVVVVSPAHQFLFTSFDSSIGHFRRYTRGSLAANVPPSLRQVRLRYLDSVGFFASLANKLFLDRPMPTTSQIKFWDTVLVSMSTYLDRFLFYRFGKSVLGVWRRPDDGTGR